MRRRCRSHKERSSRPGRPLRGNHPLARARHRRKTPARPCGISATTWAASRCSACAWECSPWPIPSDTPSSRARTVKHGKLDRIAVTKESVLFSDMPETFSAVRYHSLAVDIDERFVTSRSENDGTVMSIEDRGQKCLRRAVPSGVDPERVRRADRQEFS